MQKLFCSVALLLMCLPLAAQHSISGTVREAGTQRRIEGAAVRLDESNRLVVTDAMGRFRLDQIEPGQYTLSFSHVAFNDLSLPVSVPSESDVMVFMDEATTLTDEVVVQATRASATTPTTYTHVSKEEISKQNFGQDMPYLLNWTPSVVTTSDAGTGIGYTSLRIRGSDASRINVTINGIPYNDSESLNTFWVDIPDIASSSQDIQIQRGIGTSTNGAGAFGGTVNLQTLSLERDPKAEVTTAVGSFDTWRTTVKAGTGLINDHWAIDGRFSKIQSAGYIDRASADLTSYYAGAGYYGDKLIAKALVFGGHEVTYQSWYGVDEATLNQNRTFNYAGAIYDDNGDVLRYYDNQVDDYRQDHAQFHLSYALSPNTTISSALHYTRGKGFYEEYYQDLPFGSLGLPDLPIGNSVVTSGDFITRKWLDNHFYGATFSLQHTREKFNAVLGGGYHRYTPADHFGEIIWGEYAVDAAHRQRFYQGEADKADFNVFGKLTYALTSRLQGYLDLQYRRITYETAGVDDGLVAYDIADAFNFFNPKAGLNYELSPENSLYVSYGVGHREPTRSDYLDSDRYPKAERMANLEAGWRKKTNTYQLEVNYYLMQYKDQLVLTGELNNVGTPIRANVGKSHRTGIEAAGAIRLLPSLYWNLNATWSNNINRNYFWVDEDEQANVSDTPIILSPEWIGGSQLAFRVSRQLEVTWLSKYVGAQYLDNTENESLRLDAYWVNDLRLNYEIHPKGLNRLQAALLINNVLDTEYASNGYSYAGTPYFYPQAGRNFMLMLTIAL